MLIRATVFAVAFLAFGATFTGVAVATSSVVDQYTEQLPTPAGEAPSTGSGGSSNGGSGSSTGSGNQPVAPASEPAQGTTGAATSGRKENSGGEKDRNKSGSSAQRSSKKDREADTATPAIPIADTDQPQTSGLGSGMGVFFPIVLLVSALLFALVAIDRHRSENRHRPE